MKPDALGWPRIDVSKGARYPDTRLFSDRDSLYLIERNLVLSAVVELSCPRRFMIRDLLRYLQLAAVFQVGGDTGRAEAMIPNPRFDAGRFRTPLDDAVSVLLKEGISCQPAGLAASGAEEIAVHVIANACRFYIECDKGRYHTLKPTGRGFFLALSKLFGAFFSKLFGV